MDAREKIIRKLETHPKGISLLPGGNVPELDGYVIALTNNIVDAILPETIDDVLDTIEQKPLATMIGGWLSKETGQYYIDAATLIKDKEEAIRVAREHKQEAIYDVRKGKTIYI